jgi:hypothetical protein
MQPSDRLERPDAAQINPETSLIQLDEPLG